MAILPICIVGEPVLHQPTAPVPLDQEGKPEPDMVTLLDDMYETMDAANGVGASLDPREWMFMNTDLVVHLHREPEGEWIGISAKASIGPDGIGMTAAYLYDRRGPVGCTRVQWLTGAGRIPPAAVSADLSSRRARGNRLRSHAKAAPPAFQLTTPGTDLSATPVGAPAQANHRQQQWR